MKAIYLIAIIVCFVMVSSVSGYAGWYNTTWDYRINITVNISGIQEDMINFPILIHLNSSRVTITDFQNDGGDIRFTDWDNNTVLSYEIEHWNITDGYVWVKVPYIPKNSYTNIYMYYGNNYIINGWDPTAVWSNNFTSVYHMQNASGNFIDSTLNTIATSNNMFYVNNGTVANESAYKEGSNSYISLADDSDLNSLKTVEVWAQGYYNLATSTHQPLMNKYQGGVGGWYFEFINGGVLRLSDQLAPVVDSTYSDLLKGNNQNKSFYYTITTNATITALYINGTYNNAGLGRTGLEARPVALEIGKENLNYWYGFIDEIRYSDILRSTYWINATYQNIKENIQSYYTVESLFNFSWSWSSPVANISSGSIGDGIHFNSTYTWDVWDGLGTLYNITAVFNNIGYIPTLVSGTTYTYTTTLPTVTTTTSIPYYYSAYLLYDGVTHNLLSSVGYVSVVAVNLTNCVNGTPSLRFDSYDEESPLTNVYTTFYGTFKVYASYPNSFTTYNITLPGNRTHFICIYPSITSSVVIDADIRYDNESYYYPPRYYFMRNAVIDNVTDQINLYILNSTYATNIQFMVINSNNIPQADILVNVQRFYESEGVYRSVAMGMTADDGYTNIRLRPYDIYYRPIVSRNGTVLRTFTPIVLTTVQNILTISEDLVSGYWKYNKNIMHSCGFNNVTNILQCDAVVTTGESLLFKMEAWEILPVSTDTICLKEATGSAVTLLCDLGNMTGRKFTAKFWAVMETNHDLLDELSWDLDITGMFGVYGLLFMAMFIMAMVMVSLFNPAVALIACLIGIMIGLSMNLMTISNPAIISLILVIIIGLYKVRS
jgi:hypothetical protein